MKILSLTAALFLTGAMCSSGAENGAIFPHPERIRYDSHGMQIDGNDTFIFSGAFHYFRCPKELWAARFQKIKEAGFTAVETYVPWNWHEQQAPNSPEDYSKVTGLQDLDQWMTLAEKSGLYVIIRPGPYVCSEWSGGGYPQWLVATKKPKDWPENKQWLQTEDPGYLEWCRHWYHAVCPLIAKHQVTHKEPGQRGVILFQIENEFERVNWINKEGKRRYLEALATDARDNGIDVPIFTCWTRQSRNAQDGPLHGVFDMMNFYPKWEITKHLREFTRKQRREQPYAPAASAELQAGWYSEVGGNLSQDLDGVAPVQTQNLTLYELQLGFSIINYYMLFGGTNLDDWASRETTTTYDFFAPIRENGGVGEKYRRVWGIGHILLAHGKELMRSELVDLDTTVSDPVVEIAERKSKDGSRFIFVRTEDHISSHKGRAEVKEKEGGGSFSFDFQLEPFGSMVLYLAPGVNDPKKGEWLPKLGPSLSAPSHIPGPVALSTAIRIDDPLPENWTALAQNDLVENHGVMGRHFIHYRVAPAAGQPFTVMRVGEKVMNNTKADGVLAMVNGILLPEKESDKDGVTFEMPPDGKDAILLYESRGLQQHTTVALEQSWNVGVRAVRSGGRNLSLQFADDEREKGILFSTPKKGSLPGGNSVQIGKGAEAAPEALLTWHRIEFQLPKTQPGVWVPWQLHFEAQGNGFIYLNGHCIGRYWQSGPQHDFFLPECWLNFGEDNAIAISLRPLDRGVKISAASIEPVSEFAEAIAP